MPANPLIFPYKRLFTSHQRKRNEEFVDHFYSVFLREENLNSA